MDKRTFMVHRKHYRRAQRHLPLEISILAAIALGLWLTGGFAFLHPALLCWLLGPPASAVIGSIAVIVVIRCKLGGRTSWTV
jgi:hypothetical protein